MAVPEGRVNEKEMSAILILMQKNKLGFWRMEIQVFPQLQTQAYN